MMASITPDEKKIPLAMANQLKVFELTTLSGASQPSSVSQKFVKLLHDARAHGPVEAKARPLQLLAVSDPNDILSWEVSEREIPPLGLGESDMTVANLYLGTTGQVFGLGPAPIAPLAASPYSAHLNYLKDSDVADIVVCGVRGAQILRCSP